MTEDWQNGGFGLYIHWPFCQAKCPYCDFNSHVTASIDQSRWCDAYLAEIDRYSARTGDRILDSVFFGGGTPSLMNPDVVAAILERVRRSWRIANDFEVTLEANPTSVEASRFRGYRDAGVTRVSMGIQALDDQSLRGLGRLHTAAEARQAFDVARSTFDRVSFDMIYARQSQTLAQWQAELREALSMAIDHLSLYQLTIEPGTAFGDRYAKGGLRGLPDEDLGADLYEATQETCDQAGMPAYEVSNHARPGSESRHNLIYWRYGDYIGIGPGAHGRLTEAGVKHATEAVRQPGAWLDGLGQQTHETLETISGAEQAQEMLMMGLRLDEGVSTGRYQTLSGEPLDERALTSLEDFGLIERTDERLRVTRQGRPLLNAVLRELLGA
ncbi:oxygen-independent coproporphyrinogen-3 oxidase [Tranquillimonas rosea]|uniref:Heme chaperone HemW n=1 Tax=Tranquillimonas rosea TaxID=641238 RepID=A0A1H9UGJ1_9RHOB|nr:radical SAM family heme chaperone HemW [Tranquillimonas rosea]SES08173.1 oxygen-independent coproporphyrinogen-3 oxidase [Tranquillimonas rosea]